MIKSLLKILIKKLMRELKSKMREVMKVKRKRKKKSLEMMSVRLRFFSRMTSIDFIQGSQSKFGTYMHGCLPIL